jgi:hypothetical protein
LTKCFYYILSWRFDENGNAIPTTIEEQGEECPQISIPNTDQGSTIIEQKEVRTWHKTLGCFKTIEGNKEEQVRQMTSRSNTIGVIVKNAKLSWKEINITFNMI